MNLKKVKYYMALFAGLFIFYSQASLALEPGRLDFSEATKSFGQPVVEINLGETLISLFSEGVEEKELSDILKTVTHVKLFVFENLNESHQVESNKLFEQITSYTQQEKWEQVIATNENGEKTRVLVKIEDGNIVGSAILTFAKNEVVLINVVGNVPPNKVKTVTKFLGKAAK